MENISDNLEVTLFDIDQLIPDPNNVRIHDNRNRDAVRRSIKRFGLRKPVVASKETKIVYAGNLTLDIAIELGFKEIPVAWIPEGTPEVVCRAYAAADNKTSELGSWDTEKLNALVKDLEVVPDLSVLDTGFDLAELKEMLPAVQQDETFDIDKAMADESEPITKTGDIWLCGRWVYCPECGRRHDL